MAKHKRWNLIVEELDRTVSTEAVNVWDYATFDGMLKVWSKAEGDQDSTVTVYNTRNFRSLTLEPVEEQ